MRNTLFGILNLNLMHVGSPGIVPKVYPYPGYCATVLQKSQNGLGNGDLTELTEIPGTVRKCYKTHRSSGYGGAGVQNSRKL